MKIELKLSDMSISIGLHEVDRLPHLHETVLVEYPSMLTTGTVPWKVIGVDTGADPPVVYISEEWLTDRLVVRRAKEEQ